MRVLAIIEPDTIYASRLRQDFEAAGYRVESFSEPDAAIEEMGRRAFALAILDLALDAGDPFETCRRISSLAPLITVATECVHDSCARALECGADDCVRRHVEPRELLARVHNVLRRTDGTRTAPQGPSVSISLSEMRVRHDGVVHDLSRGETEVLALLLQHAPSPLTPARIAELLPARRTTVETRIKSLRAKLGRALLVSRGRFGYELADHVEES